MFKREMWLEKIRPFYKSDLIKVLTGIRRCGKSVLMRQIIEEIKASGVEESHIIFINFEDLSNAYIKNEIDLFNCIKKQIVDNGKYFLFFDEIQNVENFEKAINSFRSTLNVSIFITGSNAKLLSGELATLLSGRYVNFKIMPFSFKESCEIQNIDFKDVTDKDLFNYIKWGGMPQRFSMKSEDELNVFIGDLYDSIVLKDIVKRYKVQNIELLNRIVNYLVTNTSQMFSASSITNFLKSEKRDCSRETLYNYLSFITSSYIMHKVSRYDIKGKKELSLYDKYYLTDTGFGRIYESSQEVNVGAELENVVFNELQTRGCLVYVGKNINSEIDFVTTKPDEKCYYQVAYLLADDKTVQREFGAYDSVKDNFPKYVISADHFDFSRNGIIHKNIIDFLLGR